MFVKPITGRQSGELCRLFEERGVFSEEFQYLIENPDLFVGLIRQSRLPDGRAEILNRQIARLIQVEAHQQLGLSQDEYREELQVAVGTFQWREDLAAIDLDKVALVDPRLPGDFLAKAGGVTCSIDSDGCSTHPSVVMPDDPIIMVIQGQWGPNYRNNKKPFWCYKHFHPLEQGLTVKEGLTVFLYEGKPLLENCFMNLPGSLSERGNIPYLCLWNDEPRLSDYWVEFARPGFGSASRGR